MKHLILVRNGHCDTGRNLTGIGREQMYRLGRSLNANFKGRRLLLCATAKHINGSASILSDGLLLTPRRHNRLDDIDGRPNVESVMWVVREWWHECDTLILVVGRNVITEFPPHFMKEHFKSRDNTDLEDRDVDEGGAVILDIESGTQIVIHSTYPLPG